MAHPGGPWDLQEAITEQRTATRTATQLLTLHLDKNAAPTDAPSPKSTRELRLKARLAGKKPTAAAQPVSYNLRILQGKDVIKTIDITKLLTRDHEIRLVPPTRATILYSDPDQPSREPLSRLHSQIDSQEGSQTVSQSKQNCFLKLCFHSLGDLKSASQAFLRLGLRCKTQFKTPNRSMSRTPSVTPGPPEPRPPPARSPYPEHQMQSPAHSQPSQQNRAESPYSVRSYSPPPPARTPADFARPDPPYSALEVFNTSAASTASKRAYTDIIQGSQEVGNAPKRGRSVAMNDTLVPSLTHREPFTANRAASLWSTITGPDAEREGSRSRLLSSRLPSMSPSISRLGSIPPERQPVAQTHQDVNGPMATPDKPPPRRELPASIQRHMSRTPSRANGDMHTPTRLLSNTSNTELERLTEHATEHPLEATTQSTAAIASSTAKPTKTPEMAEIEVQTEVPFIAPEVAFFAGMEAFQDLSSLKDQMLKECMDATRRLGEGGYVEEEARLIACYAIQFRSRFLEICSQKAGLLSMV